MSAVRARSNINGRSRSPSPRTHATQHNTQTATVPAKNNFLNPENSNLSRDRRSTSPDRAHTGHSENIPLIDVEKAVDQPPLANPEVDDNVDDREVVNRPYPGVDDGFFPNDGGPIILTNRAGGGDEVETIDDAGGTKSNARPPVPPTDGRDNRHFPDIEFGTIPTDTESIPDINAYQHKKTLAQGMMDLALFSANANQLRYVLESDRHPYYYPGIILISISLIFQVAIGVGLIWNAHYNVKDEKEICIANKINNFTIIGIFLVTVINVLISSFGVASVQPVVATAP